MLLSLLWIMTISGKTTKGNENLVIHSTGSELSDLYTRVCNSNDDFFGGLYQREYRFPVS